MQSRGRLSLVVARVAMILVSSAAAATAKQSPKAAFSARVRAIGTRAQRALLAMPPATTSPNPTDAAWRDAILHGTAQQAADASHKLYLNPESVRGSNAMARINLKGYYFGTFFH